MNSDAVISNLTFGRSERRDEKKEEKHNNAPIPNWEEVTQTRVTFAAGFLASLHEIHLRFIGFYDQMKADLKCHGQMIQPLAKGNPSKFWPYLKKNPSAGTKALKYFASLASLKSEEMSQTVLRSTRSHLKGLHGFVFDTLFCYIREEFRGVFALDQWSILDQVGDSFCIFHIF